jgi:hypothetical protein
MPMDFKISAFSKAAPYVLVLKLKRDQWEKNKKTKKNMHCPEF